MVYTFKNLDGFVLHLNMTVSGTGEFHLIADPIPEDAKNTLIAHYPNIGECDKAKLHVVCDVSGEYPVCRYYLAIGGHDAEINVDELFDTQENAYIFGKEVLLGIDYFD